MKNLSTRALNRALLARQMLLRRKKTTALGTIEHLVGMQSQLPNSPYVGLWSRLVKFDQSELADLYHTRQVVRLAMMRSTIHLVSAHDCLSLRPVVQPVLERGFNGGFSKFLSKSDHEEIEAAGRSFVEAKPATFSDLGRRLSEKWPDRHGEYKSRVYPNNGIIQPTVLVDGFVEGKWKVTSNDKKATLNVEAFRRLTKTERAAIEEEGELLLEFAARNSKARDIRVSGP